jgi:hypothetical protein
VKSIEHRPASIAFDLCRLGVLENVDETGAGSEHEYCENQLHEIRSQPWPNQGHAQDNSEYADPRPAASAEHDTRQPRARYRANREHQQGESDLPVGEMKVILEGRQPRDQAAAHHAEQQEGKRNGGALTVVSAWTHVALRFAGRSRSSPTPRSSPRSAGACRTDG